MKKILVLLFVIVGVGIVSRTLIPNQSEKASDTVRISDVHFEKPEAQATQKSVLTAPTLREQVRVLEDQIQQYERILKSENAIDRINHNEVSGEERQRYFDIIRELTAMRIHKTNLKIEELEHEG